MKAYPLLEKETLTLEAKREQWIKREERKVEAARSRAKVVGYREEVEGRIGVEEERKRREAEAGIRTKVRHDDRENNTHTG